MAVETAAACPSKFREVSNTGETVGTSNFVKSESLRSFLLIIHRFCEYFYY